MTKADKIKVSVIIPVFNSMKYLRPCLDSAVNQTLKELEIIIIDDGSRDRSREIVNEYAKKDSRIVFIKSDIPSGFPGVPRNRGLERAQGEYIAFLDSDDRIKPEMYEVMYNRARKDDLDIVGCKYEFHKLFTRRVLYSTMVDATKIYNCRDNPEILSLFPALWNKIYRRELLKGVEIQRLKRGEDLSFFWQVLIKAKRIGRVDTSFYCYRSVRKGSILKRSDKPSYDIFKHFEGVTKLLKRENLENLRADFDVHRMTTIIYELNRINIYYKPAFFKRVVREAKSIDSQVIERLHKFHRKICENIKKDRFMLFLVYHYLNKIYEMLSDVKHSL
ncbi:MAG: glycosyltransferase [Spirochaetales bacterium]|nr:glycosyltransferase [Spirochaetales bacterium]